ncbi:SP family xylose:H+ symportor-like MFS transporter [Geomicrobium halophilum]|uniref:SP family xylose:H+ symportor-like MFS transporter n=1 Tax=Geomicrobium halophilum TaxID=549000 RepID=A0A841PIR0_9BACL|nr:sugar porter family MFS transporter [Geomicrobium halophilum]MBB6448767.1 SP family xylose:H+ symportor-like MFS transporter [Geomicrobium halophilum]
MKSNIGSYTISVVLIASLGGLLFGYDTAVISGAEQSVQRYLVDSLGLGSFVHGVTVSSALAGCIFGALISGYLSNRIGRKNTLVIAAFLFFISALGSAYPEMIFFERDNPTLSLLIMFNFYRIIGGVGVGFASAIAPMYISEMAPQNSRGKLVALYNLAVVIGQSVVFVVNWLIVSGQTSTWVDNVGWRYMLASEMIPAAMFFLLLFFVPETPRYLALKNRETEAFSILERVNGSKQRATEILAEINYTLKTHTEKVKLFSYGKLVLFTGVLIAIFQQLIGINVIMYYAPRIFAEMGAGQVASMFQTVIVGIINVIFVAIAIKYVDNWGRKPLLIVGSIVCSISLFGVAVLSLFDIFGVSTLIFILLYVAFFQMSWGALAWVLLSEIFPNKIRGQAMSIAVMCLWVANLIVSSTFPLLNDIMGGATFAIYGIITVIAMLFVWKVVPETKGKSLEEIEEFFTYNKHTAS